MPKRQKGFNPFFQFLRQVMAGERAGYLDCLAVSVQKAVAAGAIPDVFFEKLAAAVVHQPMGIVIEEACPSAAFFVFFYLSLLFILEIGGEVFFHQEIC